MGVLNSVAVEEILKRGSIRDADVLALRRAFYNDGSISAQEAETLFRMNDACTVQDASWADFFVEANTDYIVNQAEPEGYLTLENANWLIAQISRDGRVESKTELDLLVHVLDKSRWSPASLVSFALEQVKFAVVSGEGPLRSHGTLEKGRISEGEVELLRRILYAFGGDGSVAVTRAEAEILFAIDEATADGPVNTAWTDLFVKAIANVLMATSGYAVPTREEALASEAWLDRRGDLTPGAIIRSIVNAGLGAITGSYQEQTAEERALARLERQRIEIITNEVITEGEAQWLAHKLGHDGRLTPNEAALIAYLERESPNIHPILAETVKRLGAAA